MPVLGQRKPSPDPGQGEWISYTTTMQQIWTPTTNQPVWTTSYYATTDCNCETTTWSATSSWSPTPIIVTPTPTTTSLIPIIVTPTTPAPVVVVDNTTHHGIQLSPGAVGGIIVGAFFFVLLLLLLCICCFRLFRGRRRRRYGSDTSSSSSHRGRPRRKPPIVIVDPYPRRPAANLTLVGGGNYPGTRVMVSKTQKTFVRPPPVKQMRTVRETRRTEKIRIVEDDDD